MRYLERRVDALCDVLDRAVDLKAHHLVGFIANLDWWMREARQLLVDIDEYPERFDTMRQAINDYLKAHPQGELDDDNPVSMQHMSNGDRQAIRNRLVQSISRFLKRCESAELIARHDRADAENLLGIDASRKVSVVQRLER